MNNKSKKILKEALTLSERDRAEVVEQLLMSFEIDEDQEKIDEDWRQEILRRSLEIEIGSVKPISWSKVKELTYERHSKNE